MSKRALMVIDVQNDYFPGGKWPLAEVEAVAKNVTRLIAAARQADELVIHVRHEFTRIDAPFFTPGSHGAQIHPSAAPLDGEPVVLKHVVNAFRDTELKSILDKHDVDSVTVIGSMSHMCVHDAARAAADFGYATTVIHDACATRDLEFNGTVVPAAQVHAAFMAALGFAYATLRSTDAYLDLGS